MTSSGEIERELVSSTRAVIASIRSRLADALELLSAGCRLGCRLRSQPRHLRPRKRFKRHVLRWHHEVWKG